MPDLLGAGGTAAALRALPDWTGDGAEIRRTVDLPDFPTAIDVVGAVAAEAERRDHHPDIDIRWRTLTFACATHSEGGVTSLDVDLATEIDRIVAPRVAGDGPAR